MKGIKKLVLVTFIAINTIDQPSPEVTIDQGVLSGKISKDGTFYEYTGIPYATANSGNRFQAPLPPPTWEGVYKAVDEHVSCPQSSALEVFYQEDCLKINVYVPITTQRPIPVMVYIHGGAFLLGSGGKLLYAPEFLVKHDVILITFNYRLGALGFLCLGIKEAPGNAGLKDQVAALKWVKKNIASFGGDPDNITVFGESAGGTSTSLIIASPATNGLFNRAIVQSGSSISNWAINRSPVWTASLLVKSMGYEETEEPHELYDILSKVSLKEIVNAKTEKPWDEFFETELIHLPCIEKTFADIEPVISDMPYNLLLSANRKNVSIIYGSNDKEGLFLIAGEHEPEKAESRNKGYMFAKDLEFPSKEETIVVSNRINKFYFGEEPISMKMIMNLSEIFTDMYFEMPEYLEADILLEKSNKPIYNYQFRYDGGRNLVKYLTGFKNEKGACHGDDILYLFDGRIWPFWKTKQDQVVINWITKLWTNFAKYGDPTPKFDSLPVHWMPSKKGDIKVLYIDKELSTGPIAKQEAYEMWRDIYNKYRKKTWGY